MRTVPEEMATRIESGAAKLCQAWLLKRVDGVELGFTDHDRDLIVEGVRCRPKASSIDAAARAAGSRKASSAAAASAAFRGTPSRPVCTMGHRSRFGGWTGTGRI